MSDAQWTPAIFEIAMGETGKMSPQDTPAYHENVEGETWGAFGINAEDDGPWRPSVWCVTHLPSGRKLTEAVSQEAARQFCEEIAPLTDWALVQPGQSLPEIQDAVLEAVYRARGATADEQDDEPAWPPPLIEGEPVELPGFESVEARPVTREYPS